MGVIEHVSSCRRVTLGARSLVGRAAHCNLRAEDALTSAEHAVIQWRQDHWTLRDLGSSNGTQLNGEALVPGQRQPLSEDAKMTFGSQAALWRLVDASSPVARARRVGATHDEGGASVCEADDGLLALPDADAPVTCLFCDDEGEWWVELDGPTRRASDQELLTLPTSQWRLELPPTPRGKTVATTRQLSDQPTLLDEAQLRFRVSRDEEHVELSVVDGDRTFDLGARAHNYLLLTLARARLKDAAEQEGVEEQGWQYADDLAAAIAVDLTQLNLHVYRARRQLAKAGVLNAGKIVERRAGSRQLRLGVSDLAIDQPG